MQLDVHLAIPKIWVYRLASAIVTETGNSDNAVHQFKDWRTALAPPMPTSVDTGTVVVGKSNLQLYRETVTAHPKPL